MSNNQVNLGKLEFEQIKDGLIEYMKSQTLLKDYNFKGSIMNSVIDLLAYNTFYYALYSNMLANEMFLDTAQREESLVSLTKPLGVTIPTRTSARANIRVGGSATIPQFTRFTGINNDGVIYNFYTYKLYEAGDGIDFIDDVELIEGSELIEHRNITTSLDLTRQTYFIPNINIDVSTIIVEVDSGDGIWNLWNKMDNIGDSTENLSQRIYFVERFDTGFELQFGIENSLGNSIVDTDNVRISYLVSSGSSANEISTFRNVELTGNITIEIVTGNDSPNYPSKGGLDSPDLAYFKFIAPKFFAAQNRAVTKDDFLAISAEYLRSKGYYVNKDNFNVFGGEELTPPKYGRVFVATEEISTPDILDLVAYLKTKCTVSILPEYVNTVSDSLTYDVRVQLRNNNMSVAQKEQLRINIKNFLLANYSAVRKYNISLSGIEQAITQNFTVDVSAAFVTINYNKSFAPTTATTIINIENPLEINFGAFTQITQFTDKNGAEVRLKAFPLSSSQLSEFINLRTYVVNNNVETLSSTLNYGRINANAGYIEIGPYSSELFTVDVNLKYSSFSSGTNIKFTILPNLIEFI